MQQRRFVRHPSDVPITAEEDLSGYVGDSTEYLNDVGLGGLSFQSRRRMHPGVVLNISLPIANPVFEIKGRVAWCRPNDGLWDVGVEFLEADKLFKARMVEQVCQIEHYKKEVLEREGRLLTGEEAALEWIQKFAAEFPRGTQ